MWELEIGELNISKKKLNIHGHFHFKLWESVLVLKELILTVSPLGGCGGLERTILMVPALGGCGGHKRFDFALIIP